VHGFRCDDNIHVCRRIALYTLQMRTAPNAKCQRVLVLGLWLAVVVTLVVSTIATDWRLVGPISLSVDS